MSIFGSRQDDPLLQNDPLSPSADDTAPSTPTKEHSVPVERSDSVFGRTEAPPRGDGAAGHRIVRHTAAKAESGPLTELNAAFDAGWRLDHVDLQPEASGNEENEPPGSTSGSLTLAFVLYRIDAEASHLGT